jgi:hypothetical protein
MTNSQSGSVFSQFLKDWAAPATLVSVIAGTWFLSSSLSEVKADVRVLQEKVNGHTDTLRNIETQGAATDSTLRKLEIDFARADGERKITPKD